MKKTKKKLSLSKETLSHVTGAGLTLLATEAGCTFAPVPVQSIRCPSNLKGCTLSCMYNWTCPPYVCDTQIVTCAC